MRRSGRLARKKSSGSRWEALLPGAVIARQLVDITDGLHVANEYGESILRQVGETYILGEGNTVSFKPTLWTGRWVASGTYSATFRLLDLNFSGTPFPASGTFSLDFGVADGHEKVSWKD